MWGVQQTLTDDVICQFKDFLRTGQAELLSALLLSEFQFLLSQHQSGTRLVVELRLTWTSYLCIRLYDYRDCSIFMKYFLQMDAIRFKFCSFARDLCRWG